MTLKQFNIRVYAIIIEDKFNLLISDEYLFNMRMTKFPGGGLNLGEGPADCIRREALEEFGQEIEITGHFYTTDFFQQALFYKDSQLISIYYLARFKGKISFRISNKPFDFDTETNGGQSFRWINIRKIKGNEMTFPIDQLVLKMLRDRINDQ